MNSSRELVKRTLEFKNNERVPRHLWTLPWAEFTYPDELAEIRAAFPDDIITMPYPLTAEGFTGRPGDPEGEPYEKGTYLDVWGCRFTSIHRGVIGEVKQPIITDDDWLDDKNLVLPEKVLDIDKAAVNKFCKENDKFIVAGDWARPFERLQFIRGTAPLYMDLILRPKRMLATFERVHDFYCRLIKTWAETDVDAVWFMDDWGSQKNLLIDPKIWSELFKPMYRDYAEIAHKHGKKIFMHSDGNTLGIIPELIEIGIDAVNTQIFCIGVEKLKEFKGHMTFWGEMDRQHLLPHGTLADIDDAVKLVRKTLWDNGGCIAQCEFGVAANPKNVYQVFESWNSGY